MPKYDLLRNFIKIILGHGYSPVNLLQILRTPFTKNTSGWLLLEVCFLKFKGQLETIRGNLGES